MDNEAWDENLYKNWVRGAKGLEFLQEGLRDFVGDKAPECRDQQLQNITNIPLGSIPPCNQCTSQNLLPEHASLQTPCSRTTACIQRNSSNCFGSKPRGRRKCPSGICSKLYDAIVFDHCHGDPLWKNTNPTTWCSDPHGWSFAKCFETTPGPATSAQETDASGLLSILLNNRSMQNWLACHNMSANNATCPFYKARYIRNEILHKPKMQLEDLILDEYIDTFIAVLEDPKCLLTYTGSQDAVNKLNQLKSKQIHISQRDERDVLKLRKEALSELEDKKNEALQEIQESTSTGLTEMNSKKADMLLEIKEKTNTGLAAALQEIQTTTSTGLTAMSKKRAEAFKEIEDKGSAELTEMDKKRADALLQIEEKTNTGLAAALQDIQITTSTGLTVMSKKRAEAFKEIEDKGSAELTEMDKKRADALLQIEEKTNTGLAAALQDIQTTTSTGLTVMSKKRAEAFKEIEDKGIAELTEMDKKRADALLHIEEKTNTGLAAVLQEIQATTSTGLTVMSKKRAEAFKEIEDKGSAELTEMDKKRADALLQIEEKTNTGLAAVLQEIQVTTSTGLTVMSKKRAEAFKEIEDKGSAELTEMDKKKADALLQLEEKTNAGLTTMSEKRAEALKEIEDTGSTERNQMDKKRADALLVIEKKTHTGLTAMSEKKAEALKEIGGTTSTGVTAIFKERTAALQEIEATTSSGLSAAIKVRTETVQEISELKRNILTEVSEAGKGTLEKIDDRQQQILSEFEEIKTQRILIANAGGKEPSTSRGVHSSTTIPDVPTTEVQIPVLAADKANNQLKTQLQDDLISFYRNQHSKITLSPLVDADTPLLDYYVMPELQTVEVTRARGGGKEEKTPIKRFRNVFYKDHKLCKEIYLTADAGLGKTAFSKRLALAWCHAKKPLTKEKRYFSEKEEIEAMNGFRFVFLLLLRESSRKCNIDDMILDQIVSQLGHDYTSKDLKDIMSKETCLVILDGLDEWIHPSQQCGQGESNIPHRRARDCTAVLTTTRPWKVGVSGIKSTDIDHRLELSGLNQQSANALKRSVISHLSGTKDKRILEKNLQDFSRAVEKKQILDLEATPLLLMYLLFLWYYGIDLGETKCDLYSKIIELLLSRTVQISKDTSSQAEPTQGDIPKCFSTQTRCKQFYTHLTALGQIAFQTLFMETREENMLVFDSSIVEQYLNKECLSFCLSTGIITQSKVQGNPLKQESKVSFAHKTVQEYFAALYMRSTLDQTSVPEIVLSKCKCVKDILEMSKILIFLSGFSANVLSLISREMMKIINEDEIALKYRISLERDSEPLEQFQDMCVSCCKELPDDSQVSLCLQDVFIDESCQQEQYREHLKQMTTRNKQNIRSLYIDMDAMEDTPYSSAREVIEYFGLNDLENIEKIRYWGEYNDGDILPLLNSSVQSLDLWCSWCSWCPLLYEKLKSLQQLEAIGIDGFVMSHEQLTLLCDYISQRRCMRHIELERLRCTDHEWGSCTGGSVDLSQHSDLRTLTLFVIPVSQLHINMSAIEKCRLKYLSNPDLVLRFVNCDPADSKVKSFVCQSLESPVAVDALVQTLPQLWQVEYVRLWSINLGSRHVSLSPQMINIESVRLSMVAMSAVAARGLANSALTLPQPVEVDMTGCTITPREEFETWKVEIRNSPCFRLERDSEDDGEDMFGFVTIKDREVNVKHKQ